MDRILSCELGLLLNFVQEKCFAPCSYVIVFVQKWTRCRWPDAIIVVFCIGRFEQTYASGRDVCMNC